MACKGTAANSTILNFREDLECTRKMDDNHDIKKDCFIANIVDSTNEGLKLRTDIDFQKSSVLESGWGEMNLGDILRKGQHLMAQVDEMKLKLEEATSVRLEVELRVQRLESERTEMKNKIEKMMTERIGMEKKIMRMNAVIQGDDKLKQQMKKEEDVVNKSKKFTLTQKKNPSQPIKLEQGKIKSSSFSDLMLGRTRIEDQRKIRSTSTLHLPRKLEEINETSNASFSDMMLGLAQAKNMQSEIKMPKKLSLSQLTPRPKKAINNRPSFEDLMLGKTNLKDNRNDIDISNWQSISTQKAHNQNQLRHAIIPKLMFSKKTSSLYDNLERQTKPTDLI